MPYLDNDFEQHRDELQRLAYRMLGSMADADDVLQDAYVRWARVDRSDVEAPRPFLYSMVTRLCIDQRRKIDARKESYIGPWLPEPVWDDHWSMESLPVETAESISLAFLVVLESLTPTERAAYLLRRVFDYDYDAIGDVLQQSVANCRQLVSRAEARVHQRRPRFNADPREAERITGEFLEACSTGNLERLVGLLAADAVTYSDGGGKVTAALAPINGADRVARFFIGLARKAHGEYQARLIRLNGQPGILTTYRGELAHVMTLDIMDGQIVNCFVIRNPDKLARIAARLSLH